jgi:DNA-binding NarL/FixJ family response regulator/predicted transcriptional regulator
MKPAVLKVSSPEVASVFADLTAMQRWEVLRRSESPMTPEALATACAVSTPTILHTLDRLVEAGLAVRIKASVKSPRITYRSISSSVLFEYDDRSAEERRWMADQREAFKQFRRRCIDRAETISRLREKELRFFTSDTTTILDDGEAREALTIVSEANMALQQVVERARERLRSAPRPDASTESRPYYLFLQFQELDQPELPIPAFLVADPPFVKRHLEELENHASEILAPREIEVARRLARGASRPRIAKELGLSLNTIATIGKRIYSKLRVHSRAELAARIQTL